MDIGHRPVLSLILTDAIHGGMASLSRLVWLVLHQVGLPTIRQLPHLGADRAQRSTRYH